MKNLLILISIMMNYIRFFLQKDHHWKNKDLKEFQRIMRTFETVLQKKLKNDLKTLLKCH